MNRTFTLPTVTALAFCITGCSNVTKEFIGEWDATSTTYDGETITLPSTETYAYDGITYTYGNAFSLSTTEDETVTFTQDYFYTNSEGVDESGTHTTTGTWAQSDDDKRTFDLTFTVDGDTFDMNCTVGEEELELTCETMYSGSGELETMTFAKNEEAE